MVRVIKEAKPWLYKFTCVKCKSHLEATPEDVKYGEFGGIAWAGESGEWKFYVPCPVCGAEGNFVAESRLTPNLIRDIRARSDRR